MANEKRDMKVNHHQIKNAVAYVAKKVEKDFPTKKHNLSHANFDEVGNYWRFVVSDPNPLGFPEGSTYDMPLYYIAPSYFANLAQIGTDESISLDNLFIETFRIGKVLDAGWGFMNHADKISTAELMRIYPTRSYMKRYPSWRLGYSGLDKEQAEIEMYLHISNEGVIFDVELEYTKGEKAREIAENFIQQSGQILDATETLRDYHGADSGVHKFWYKGFNQQGEAVTLHLVVDAKNETILSHEITILKTDSK